MTHPARLVRWAVEHANVTYLGAASEQKSSLPARLLWLYPKCRKTLLGSSLLLWTRQQMMEDMTHVQMSLAYTLRHLKRQLSAMLSNIWGSLKLEMEDRGQWVLLSSPKSRGFFKKSNRVICTFYLGFSLYLDRATNSKVIYWIIHWPSRTISHLYYHIDFRHFFHFS